MRPPERPFGIPTFWALLFLLLAALLLTWLHGYSYGDSNHTVQVPLVKSYIDPGLYEDDALLLARGGYATMVYPVLGFLLPRVEWVEPTFFVLFLLAQVLTLGAGAALARRLFPGTLAPVVMVFLMMARVPGLAAERGFVTRFAHTDLAFGVLLWALYLALVERRGRAAGLTGLAFNLHGSYTLYTASMLGLDALCEPRGERLRVLALARRAGFFVLAALPTLVWVLWVAEPMTEEWLRLVRLRSGHHSFPFDFPAQSYGRYALLLALGAVSLRDKPTGAIHRRVGRFALALVPLLVAGVIFTEFFPLKAVIQAQFFRSTRFLSVFVLLYLGHFLVRTWERGGPGRLAVVLCAAGLGLPRFEWLLPFVVVLFLLLEPRSQPGPRLTVALSGLICALVWGGYAVPSPLFTPHTVSYLELATDPLTLGWLVVFLAGRSVLGRASGLQAAVALAALLFLSVFSVPSFYQRLRADYRDHKLVRLQRWLKRNTPVEATLLTPPDLAGLRVFSERSVVGEWKDGTLQYFSLDFNREWYRRMTDLGGGRRRGYDALDAATLASLAERYGAGYIVVPAARKLPLPKLHQVAGLAIYEAGRSPDGVPSQHP